jgi:hypothetical protein
LAEANSHGRSVRRLETTAPRSVQKRSCFISVEHLEFGLRYSRRIYVGSHVARDLTILECNSQRTAERYEDVFHRART